MKTTTITTATRTATTIPTAAAAVPGRRTALLALAAAGAVAALPGCVAMTHLTAEVSSYGEWPAGRRPSTYAFERLPSQQARAAEAEVLETAARGALARAGFVPAAAGAEPDVLVQLGSRVGRADAFVWDDPLWWRGGFGYYRHGPWIGPRWGFGLRYELASRYEHQVALLLRDRASGKPLFESRASRETGSALTSGVSLATMFDAALVDFPRQGLNPRTVTVPLATAV